MQRTFGAEVLRPSPNLARLFDGPPEAPECGTVHSIEEARPDGRQAVQVGMAVAVGSQAAAAPAPATKLSLVGSSPARTGGSSPAARDRKAGNAAQVPPRRPSKLCDGDLEEAVLGSMLYSSHFCAEALGVLVLDDFCDERARLVFRAMKALGKGDPVLVKDWARGRWEGDPAAVAPYVHELVQLGRNEPAYLARMLAQRTRRNAVEAGELLRKVEEVRDDADVHEVIRDALALLAERSASGDELALVESDTFRPPEPIRWVLHPYIPAAHLTLVEGEEGIGKGLFCAWQAVEASKRGEKVLWVSTEDDPEREINARLLAAGHNPRKDQSIAFAGDPFAIQLPRDMDLLSSTVERIGAKLVILDAGRDLAYPEREGQARSNNDDAMIRPVLTRLHRMAVDTGAAVVFLHHFNKLRAGDTRSRSGGSVSFRQGARHVVVLAREDGSAALGVAKSNISDRSGTVRAYSVRVVDLGGEVTSAQFALGDPEPHETIDAWIQEGAAERREKREEARAADRPPCPECGGPVAGPAGKRHCSERCKKRAYGKKRAQQRRPATVRDASAALTVALDCGADQGERA